jgi:hypothetical protein
MLGFVEMLGGVLVLGRVAAAYVPTAEAQAQVNPSVSRLNAFLTDMLIGFLDFDLVQVGACFRHRFLQEMNLEFLGQVTSVM